MNPEDSGINPQQLPVQRNYSIGPQSVGPQAGGLSTNVLDGQENEEFDIDIKTFWHVLVKRRWTIAAAVALVFIITLIVSLLITPVYRATSTVQIDRELMNVSTQDSAPVQDYWMDPDYINTQYQVLQSRELACRVLVDMGFQD